MAAKEFGVLPSQVARDMERDPRRLTITCFPLLSYSRCKAEYDAYKGDDKQLEHWKGSATLEAVKENTMQSLVELRDHRKHRAEGRIDTCRICRTEGEPRG